MNNALEGFRTGTLVDSDILSLASTGRLIVDDFVAGNVKQACYELRASDVFWETWSSKENKRIEVDASAGYLLKPNRYVVAIVKERIVLPFHSTKHCGENSRERPTRLNWRLAGKHLC